MPQLSDTMHEGKILSWRKHEGESVARGDILAEVETDKANLEIEAFVQGTLVKVLVPAGQVAKVGQPIALVGGAGESAVTASVTAEGSVPSLASVASAAPQAAQPQAATQQTVSTNGLASRAAESPSDRVRASPLARKLAAQSSVDLSMLQGSGPQGRIVRKDVEAAAGSQGTMRVSPHETQAHSLGEDPRKVPPATAISSPARQVTGGPGTGGMGTGGMGTGRSLPLSKMRETIARRMQESVRESPHFYTTVAINMREALRLREALKELPDYKGISVNHLVIKAAGLALSEEPRVNNALRDRMLYEPPQINIGIITAIEDGLLIPVIQNVPALCMKDLVFEARSAVERARAGRPNANDLVGGTFSISNMGMFDVENFTAIINPGQGAVLAVSAVQEVPVVESGHVVPGLMMKATLSVDHRIIDGIMAAQFMRALKRALEVPGLLMA